MIYVFSFILRSIFQLKNKTANGCFIFTRERERENKCFEKRMDVFIKIVN